PNAEDPPSTQTLTQDFLEDDPSLANAVDATEFGTGYRPLHYAAYGGFLGVCEALHAAGARPLAAGDNGVTALFLAAQAGKADVVRFLLDLGADPTARERESGLCAMDVASESDPDVFRQMQEKGGFEVPPAPEVPPMVTRIESSSLQMAYLPFPEASGQLPVTRYKVKVEHPGDDNSSNQAAQPPNATDAASAKNASNTATARGNTPLDVDGAEGAENAPRVPPAADDPDACGDDNGFANPTLSKVVLVPSAGGTNSTAEGVRQKRTFVTVKGLKPATRYRVKVAAINALGFGPYGPPSAAVMLPEKTEGEGEGEGSSTAKEHESSVGAERAKKGKGRQVLAREKRRSMAAQAARLQEQQLLEAKERQQRRRAQSQEQQQGSSNAKVSGRQQLAATAGGDYGRHTGGVGAGGDGRERILLTESSAAPHHHRSRSQPRHDGVGLAARAAAKTTPAQRAAEPPPSTAAAATAVPATNKAGHRGSAGGRRRQADERYRRGRGERPVTTTTTTTTTTGAAAEQRDRSGNDGPPGRRRLIATAPPLAADTTETPRYLAATSAGRMSARAYRQRADGGGDGTAEESHRGRIAGSNAGDNQPLRGSPSPRVADKKASGGSSSKRFGGGAGSGAGEGTGGGRGAGGRQRRRRPAAGENRGGCSSSDVSMSSCGDMTISSEEQEGEEMAYTG
ncbi:unnamed protein product, partial [Ectocarpus fasciculatus]